ncbi:MAG: response regulator [Rhizobiaceae bacterium]|nr:response regulator [Rhizobiaceae bacterium]MCV0404991.1 response regulator [Rhizobiaceae bacterium]
MVANQVLRPAKMPERDGARGLPLAAGLIATGGAGVAALAFATGSSVLVVVAVAMLTVVATAATWRQAGIFSRRGDERAARDQLESLADRMWELQESEERLLGLIDALGDLVVHRDREGRIVYANRVVADLSGRDPKLLPGRTLSEIGIDVGLVPDAAFADGDCLSSKDVQVQTADGPRWFSWIELSVRDGSSQAVSHRAIARDITARKRAEIGLNAARERAEQASQAKSRFLATVSHEIRTPMNGVIGMAKLLVDTPLTKEQQTYVGAISTSASALMALIDDLLDFSKIEAGRFSLEAQPVRPRELVENVAELLAGRAIGKGIGLGCHVAPDVPVSMVSDPGRLRQVLLNLLGNAIKFTDSGGVLVTATMEQLDGRPALAVTVRDTGPGLEKADLDRIFEEFEQADSTTTRQHGGAGLGLAISRHIVEAMGGRLRVESTVGVGSDFSFIVPAQEAERPDLSTQAALRGRRGLILSTNAAEAEGILLTLIDYGAEAELARTAEEAVDRAGDGSRFDFVIVDAAADTSAGRTLQRLKSAGIVDGPSFITIAPSDRGRLAEFKAGGYESFLIRPVRSETLVRLLLRSEAVPDDAMTRPRTGWRKETGEGLNILLAEDNEINALLARTALTRAGHTVTVVGNGKAAVDAMTDLSAGRRFDAVLMDLHMPVMDGLDAITAIRRHEQDRGSRQVPIMVLSADGQDGTRQQLLAHGATGFLSKPIDPAALLEAVREQVAA